MYFYEIRFYIISDMDTKLSISQVDAKLHLVIVQFTHKNWKFVQYKVVLIFYYSRISNVFEKNPYKNFVSHKYI